MIVSWPISRRSRYRLLAVDLDAVVGLQHRHQLAAAQARVDQIDPVQQVIAFGILRPGPKSPAAALSIFAFHSETCTGWMSNSLAICWTVLIAKSFFRNPRHRASLGEIAHSLPRTPADARRPTSTASSGSSSPTLHEAVA